MIKTIEAMNTVLNSTMKVKETLEGKLIALNVNDKSFEEQKEHLTECIKNTKNEIQQIIEKIEEIEIEMLKPKQINKPATTNDVVSQKEVAS